VFEKISDVCVYCLSKNAEHCLCRKCMQRIINKCNKQGAVDEVKKLIQHFGTNEIRSIDMIELLEYTDRRLKELHSKSGQSQGRCLN